MPSHKSDVNQVKGHMQPAGIMTPSKRTNRVGVSAFFVVHGLCFATWASRIPSIQSLLHLEVSALGMLLFALPLGFLISLPFAGWSIAKIGSRKVTSGAAVALNASLLGIGLCRSTAQVGTVLFLFGFFANVMDIAMNTQAVAVEERYGRRLMGVFHGLWSTSGLAGAAIGSLMIGSSIPVFDHFTLVSVILLALTVVFSFRLIPNDQVKNAGQPFLAVPDKFLITIGLIAFCSMMIEGAMFDWSSIYFKDVVHVPGELTGLGYTIFMVAMAGTRFMADRVAGHIGLKRILQVSGTFVAAGLLLAALHPQLYTTALAFLMVGMGVSSVVPMTFSAAGKSKTMSAGTALTIVSFLGFLGFLVGPPLIGFIAGASSLRDSFLMLTVMSAGIITFSSLLR